MNRFKENTIIIGKGVELTEDEILSLEIEMIELGRLIETDKLEYNDKGQLIVIYEQQSSNSVPAPIYNPHPIYGSSQRSSAG